MKLGLGALKCKFHDIDSINLRAENESFFGCLFLAIITWEECDINVT